MTPEHARIAAKVKLDLPLTDREKAIYILFIMEVKR